MAAQNRREVERVLWQVAGCAGLFVAAEPRVDVIGLVVEDKGQEIVFGTGADIAGLVDKYRKFSHGPASLIKRAGETPGNFDRPSFRKVWSLFTTF